MQELLLRHPASRPFAGVQPFSLGQMLELAQRMQSRAGLEQFLTGRLKELRPLRGLARGGEAFQPYIEFGGITSWRGGRIAGDARSRLGQRFVTGLRFSPDFEVHNVIRVDQELLDDSTYVGRRWRGLAAFTEQAYAVFSRKGVRVKFGRDFVRWGRGLDAALLLSDDARPIDHIQFQLRTRRFQFSYFAGKLNTVEASDSLAARVAGATRVERYLTAGRAAFRLFDSTLQIGINQAVLYGTGGGFEWFFLNPFITYHGEILNGSRTANSFGSIDFSFAPRPGLELYGELLVDDLQIENSTLADLEPAEYGVLAGARVAEPGGLAGLTLGVEYTRVTNRTYNAELDFEKYMQRGRPIGHFLGNDFDRWRLHATKYLGKDLLLSATADFIRHGEGRVAAPFEQPWLKASLATGYSEPFPTGTVEKSRRVYVALRWHPDASVYTELTGRFSGVTNAKNIPEAEGHSSEVYLRVWFEWMHFFRI